MVKVSVIIPVYNVENYLEKCLTSVINQTLKDIEIICINDGSTDNSFNILKRFEYIDKRIIIYNQENCGVSRARNIGIENASGEYVAFLDSDDFVSYDFYEKLYNIAKKRNLDIVKGNVKLVNAVGEEKEDSENYKISLSGTPPSIELFNSKWWSAIYNNKNIIKKYNIRFPETISYKEDTVFLFSCKVVSKGFDIVSDSFYYYNYQRINSLSNSVSYKSILDAFYNIYFRILFLNSLNIDIDLYCKYAYKCIRTMINYIYVYKIYTFVKYKVYDIIDIIKIVYSACKYKNNINNIYNDNFILNIDMEKEDIYNFIKDSYVKNIKNVALWSDIKRYLTSKTINIEYNKITYEHKYRLAIKHTETTFETFFLPKPYKKLYVFLSATGHWDAEYPYFERVRWAKDMNGMCLFIDDPTRIEKKINLSYFFGNNRNDYKDYIVDIVKHIAYIYNIEYNNICFVGHSNAGFACIYLCNKISGSKCIALSPQLSIFDYFNDNKREDAIEFESKMNISRNDKKIENRIKLYNILDQKESKFFIFSNIESISDFNQMNSLFKMSNCELNSEFSIINNIICFTPKIKSTRPHHVWPDQFICKFFNSLLDKENISDYDIDLCIYFKEQLVKIEQQKIEKGELEKTINLIKFKE